jgi:hypothetical protein
VLLSAGASSAKGLADKPQCQKGQLQCVHHVIKEMTKRYKKLEKTCDHDAVFSLVYLLTTQKYQETALSTGYSDVSSVTREDAVFADYYFNAYDAYHSGNGYVPPAWQIAFDFAEAGVLTSQGNALLGISAHIQRDLAFTLYDLDRAGYPVSYDDHTLVNSFLAQVDASPVATLLDPTYPVGGSSDAIFFWRELAWQNFVAMRDAPDEATRAAIAQAIEVNAANSAYYFASITAYPPGTDSSQRDAYCAAR